MALKSRGEKRSVEISQHSQSQPSGAQLFGVSEAICPGVLPQSPLHIQPFTSVWMRGFHGSPPRGASVGLPDGGAPEERNMDMAHALFCCWKCDCHPVSSPEDSQKLWGPGSLVQTGMGSGQWLLLH